MCSKLPVFVNNFTTGVESTEDNSSSEMDDTTIQESKNK